MEQTQTSNGTDWIDDPIPEESVSCLWSTRATAGGVVTTCPRCCSTRGQWRGYRVRQNGTQTRRRHCNDCQRWFARAQ